MSEIRSQALRTRYIERYGELLTVQRRPATTGGQPTTQSIRFVPRSLEKREVPSLEVEGTTNVAAPMTHSFICAVGKDIREAVDSILYNGFYYEVTQVTPVRKAGMTIEQMCSGQRDRPA